MKNINNINNNNNTTTNNNNIGGLTMQCKDKGGVPKELLDFIQNTNKTMIEKNCLDLTFFANHGFL